MADALTPAPLDKVSKELAVVNAKLAGDPRRATRLALLRRQAALGDMRDATEQAARRALSARP